MDAFSLLNVLFKVFDATNTTRKRREMIAEECQSHMIEVSKCMGVSIGM